MGFSTTEQRYRLQAETARDAIFGYDLQGQITYANQAAFALSGYVWADLFGRSIRDLLPLELPQTASLEDARSQGHSWTDALLETQLVTRDKVQIPVEMSSAPLSRDGKMTGVLIVVRDIRERKRAELENRKLEQRLLQSQKVESLGVLAGGIAHDFNNLLMAILGNVAIAHQDISNPNCVRECLQSIHTSAQRAAELTRQLLAYSGKGRMVVDDEDQIRTVVGKMLQSAGMSVLYAADGKEAVDVFREKAPDLAFVLLDLSMPRMSGEEVLAQFSIINPQVKVIVTSGLPEPVVRKRFEGMNPAGFIQKPYEFSDLINKLHSVLGESP